MAQVRRISYCIFILMLAVLACGPVQKATVVPIPSSPRTDLNPAAATGTSSIAIPIPTSTQFPTPVPSPEDTPTQSIRDIGPFRGVATLAGLLTDPSGEVQVRPLADGSVWIITGEQALRWDGQAWQEVLPGNQPVLAAVDDGGKLWVLRQDTSMISAWQDGNWANYDASNGWLEVGYFENSWWAPAAWDVYEGDSGTLWVPLAKEVRAFDGTAWKSFTLKDMGFPSPTMEDTSIVHTIAMANGGAETWVGECYYAGPGPMGGGGVRWFDGQAWHGDDNPVGSQCVSAMALDEAGNIWLGASDVTWQYNYAAQSWNEYLLPDELLYDFNFTHPLNLGVDQAGNVWMIMQMCGGASCDGPAYLYRMHDGEWTKVMEAEYWRQPLKQVINDGNGQLWLFWEGAFYQLENSIFNPIVQIDARGVGISPEGNIWVVAGEGIDSTLLVLAP